MKRNKTIGLFIMMIVFAACETELLDLKFGVNINDFSYLITPTTKAGEIVLNPVSQQINLDSIAQAAGTNLDDIKSVQIKKITAFMDLPLSSNFDVLDSGILILTSPGFSPLTIAEFNQVPDLVRQFDIVPNPDLNLKEYAKKAALTLSGKLITNGPVTDSTVVRIKIEYEVTAKAMKE